MLRALLLVNYYYYAFGFLHMTAQRRLAKCDRGELFEPKRVKHGRGTEGIPLHECNYKVRR